MTDHEYRGHRRDWRRRQCAAQGLPSAHIGTPSRPRKWPPSAPAAASDGRRNAGRRHRIGVWGRRSSWDQARGEPDRPGRRPADGQAPGVGPGDGPGDRTTPPARPHELFTYVTPGTPGVDLGRAQQRRPRRRDTRHHRRYRVHRRQQWSSAPTRASDWRSPTTRLTVFTPPAPPGKVGVTVITPQGTPPTRSNSSPTWPRCPRR